MNDVDHGQDWAFGSADRQTFLAAAAQIGDDITKTAVWHQDRCNWVGATPEATVASRAAVAYAALGPDLYGGTAGVGLFLAELAAATGEPLTRRVGLGALRQAQRRTEDLPSNLAMSLYTGGLGVAVASAQAAHRLQDADLLESSRTILKWALATSSTSDYDLLGGWLARSMAYSFSDTNSTTTP